MRDVFKLIRLVHIDIFMLMMLLLGTCWGFLEAFLFVFLIELNASSTMLGEFPSYFSIDSIQTNFLPQLKNSLRKLNMLNNCYDSTII